MLDGVSIDRSTTAQRVADALRGRILAGELPPGTPLRELALTAQLGVARSTVREAMQQLTGEGLLTRSLYRGVVVTELTAADVVDIYRARRVLERSGASVACQTPPAALAPLRDLTDRWHGAVAAEDTPAGAELHLAFHSGLVRLLGSARLDATYASLLGSLRLALATVDRTVANGEEHLDSHRELLALLAAGDLVEGLAELDRHLAAAEADVLSHARLRADG